MYFLANSIIRKTLKLKSQIPTSRYQKKAHKINPKQTKEKD